MYLVLTLAAAAAAAVLLYNHYQRLEPELAETTAERAHQFASVVVALARALEGVLQALALARTQVRPAGPRLIDDWDEEGYR